MRCNDGQQVRFLHCRTCYYLRKQPEIHLSHWIEFQCKIVTILLFFSVASGGVQITVWYFDFFRLTKPLIIITGQRPCRTVGHICNFAGWSVSCGRQRNFLLAVTRMCSEWITTVRIRDSYESLKRKVSMYPRCINNKFSEGREP
jgi:hypothetical protein